MRVRWNRNRVRYASIFNCPTSRAIRPLTAGQLALIRPLILTLPITIGFHRCPLRVRTRKTVLVSIASRAIIIWGRGNLLIRTGNCVQRYCIDFNSPSLLSLTFMGSHFDFSDCYPLILLQVFPGFVYGLCALVIGAIPQKFSNFDDKDNCARGFEARSIDIMRYIGCPVFSIFNFNATAYPRCRSKAVIVRFLWQILVQSEVT